MWGAYSSVGGARGSSVDELQPTAIHDQLQHPSRSDLGTATYLEPALTLPGVLRSLMGKFERA